jgi:pyruvate dehydrogenase E2 component (dihydrolipoamide acetyltransferase)
MAVTSTTTTDQPTFSGAHRQFCLPDVGEGLTEGEVLRWLVAEGDDVVVNQPVVEVETAKAAVELPSPYAGRVVALHADEGAVLPVGAPLLTIEVAEAATAGQTSPDGAVEPAAPTSATAPAAPPPGQPHPESDAEPAAAAAPSSASGPVLVGYGVSESSTRRRPRLRAASPHGTGRPEAGPPGEAVKPVRHGGLEVGRATEARLAAPTEPSARRARAKPPVRKLARDLGVDLDTVSATGADGVVTREDVEAAARGAREERREPVRGVTRLMAEAMTSSAFTVPHVTEWLDVDVTRSAELIERLRGSDAFDGVRVTPMFLVARAVLAALRSSPAVNARFDATAGEIVHRPRVNLGFAAATQRGLVVPNIKDADQLSSRELARELAALTARAKEGTSSPAELTGGTFTVTNVGVLGVDGGTPIINPGESAILAVGAWRDKPWVHRGALAVRTVCTLALSFDHRFIDGAAGARFLVDVAARLEEPGLAVAD